MALQGAPIAPLSSLITGDNVHPLLYILCAFVLQFHFANMCTKRVKDPALTIKKESLFTASVRYKERQHSRVPHFLLLMSDTGVIYRDSKFSQVCDLCPPDEMTLLNTSETPRVVAKTLVCDDSACRAERGAFFFFTFPESCVAEELPLSGFQGIPQLKQNYVRKPPTLSPILFLRYELPSSRKCRNPSSCHVQHIVTLLSQYSRHSACCLQ